MEPFLDALGAVLYLVICLGVGLLAKQSFFRSMAAWTLLSFLFTPVIALVFLLVAGPPLDAADKVEAAQQTEQETREREEIDAVDAAWRPCPGCGSKYNLGTREGLQPHDREPWKLVCTSCGEDLSDEVREAN